MNEEEHNRTQADRLRLTEGMGDCSLFNDIVRDVRIYRRVRYTVILVLVGLLLLIGWSEF